MIHLKRNNEHGFGFSQNRPKKNPSYYKMDFEIVYIRSKLSFYDSSRNYNFLNF